MNILIFNSQNHIKIIQLFEILDKFYAHIFINQRWVKINRCSMQNHVTKTVIEILDQQISIKSTNCEFKQIKVNKNVKDSKKNVNKFKNKSMRIKNWLWWWALRKMWRKIRHRRKCQFLLLTIFTLIFLLFYFTGNRHSYSSSYCQPIDAVYTWVNGSDPEFIATVRAYNSNFDPSRFDDKNELRYSLRSLELYAPWIRHVYIVTNGQIPYWLDLSYERVTVVPHEAITDHPELLPTFSSAAIETFLHNIPYLSERFLYLNDDIFLGAPLYPEDLYTDAAGVRIYQAWMVPDCAEDCPWTYIGDGVCDRHCNIVACQFDGNDCQTFNGSKYEDGMIEREFIDLTPKKQNQQQQKQQQQNQEQQQQQRQNETKHVKIRYFPKKFQSITLKKLSRNLTSFKNIMQHKNLSTLAEIRHIVDKYNKNQQSKPKADGEEGDAAVDVNDRVLKLPLTEDSYKSSKDIYSQSLIYTNMLLNQHYGFKTRYVLAHVGFLLERSIITSMQAKFPNETYATVAHRFRMPNDLQFAFTYYSFLMNEQHASTVEEIFDEFDTDQSQTWSDREIRTFLARMYPLPLDWSVMRFFEEVVSNCSRDLGFDRKKENVVYTTLVYERYEDSNIPTITRELVKKCDLLAEALENNFSIRSKYKYNINSKRTAHSNFMMLKSNVTDVVDALDRIRQSPKKFNCINDNLEPQYPEENELIRNLLEDFYLSFFPRRSKFELAPQYRNRYANWKDYMRWRRRKRAALVVGYLATAILIIFITRILCTHKAKYISRYVQRL